LQILPSHLGDDWLRFVGPGEIVVFGMYDGSLVAKDVKPSAEANTNSISERVDYIGEGGDGADELWIALDV
jgi:hypothetical protein